MLSINNFCLQLDSLLRILRAGALLQVAPTIDRLLLKTLRLRLATVDGAAPDAALFFLPLCGRGTLARHFVTKFANSTFDGAHVRNFDLESLLYIGSFALRYQVGLLLGSFCRRQKLVVNSNRVCVLRVGPLPRLLAFVRLLVGANWRVPHVTYDLLEGAVRLLLHTLVCGEVRI